MENKYIAKKGTNNTVLSIEDHLKDTGLVAKYLAKNYCSASMVSACEMDIEEFAALFVFIACIHDIGKATKQFQAKINGEQNSFRHAQAGAAILNVRFGVNETICDVIAAHHGKTRSLDKNDNFNRYYKKNLLYTEEVETNKWKNLYENAIQFAGNHIDLNRKINVKAQMLLCGLLIMSDWIASNEAFFPLLSSLSEITETDRKIRNQKGINALSLPDKWYPQMSTIDDSAFYSRFNFYPNNLQSCVIDIANQILYPGIIVIEAPMGIGKTEAGLAAAEILSTKAGTGGVFFGLPTKGTANGILPRMISWSNAVSGGMTTSFRLAHGDVRFNESYESLMANTDSETGISINSWLAGRKRDLLSDFVVGTIDRLLMGALLQKFIMMLHVGIAGKTIIIDEVHAYDAYMSRYLETVLAWAGAYHVPVILLSATLTNLKRNDLISAYTGKPYKSASNEYPMITWSDDEDVFCSKVEAGIANKDITIKHITTDFLIDEIKKQNNICTGIILNSVKEAQALYEKLIVMLPKRRIVLLHSRYLAQDRASIENEVIRLTGKDSIEQDRKGTIIIGTQVLEQSLDIDFDILYTAKCPVDLLLQRIGRLWRHNRKRNVHQPQCYIVEDENSESIARFLYSDFTIEQMNKIITDSIISIPKDIKNLTETAYDITSAEESSSKDKFIANMRGLASKANNYKLPTPQNAEFRGMLDISAEKNEGVRYGDFTISALLLRRHANGTLGTLDNAVRVVSTPSYDENKVISKQNINLSKKFINIIDDLKEIKKSLPEWTRQDPYEYEFIIPLNESNECQIGKYIFKYSADLGMTEKKI